MIGVYVIIFLVSCFLLFWSGSKLIKGLIKMAKFLSWREFIVAFFVMAIAGSAPNLFIGINSAIHGIPQLSFGEIVGGNVADLTLAIALAILIGGTALPVRSKMVQTSAIFTVVIAILPLVLIWDGVLGRGDGLVLLLVFAFYIVWLFSKEERFRKTYNNRHRENKHREEIKSLIEPKPPRWRSIEHKIIRQFRGFFKGIRKVIVALLALLVASEGIVRSAQAFSGALSNALGIADALPIVGILIIGLGNALPETYFAIVSARRKQTWMILGDLMGAVIVCATLVLGIVALICPIEIIDFSPFAIARIFLISAAVFFLIAVRTDRKISKKEAVFLLLVYIAFVLAEVFMR